MPDDESDLECFDVEFTCFSKHFLRIQFTEFNLAPFDLIIVKKKNERSPHFHHAVVSFCISFRCTIETRLSAPTFARRTRPTSRATSSDRENETVCLAPTAARAEARSQRDEEKREERAPETLLHDNTT